MANKHTGNTTNTLRQAFLLIINTSCRDQYINSVMDVWKPNAQREGVRRSETKEYVKKEGAVTRSSPKLTRSIEITYLLNLSDLPV